MVSLQIPKASRKGSHKKWKRDQAYFKWKARGGKQPLIPEQFVQLSRGHVQCPSGHIVSPENEVRAPLTEAQIARGRRYGTVEIPTMENRVTVYKPTTMNEEKRYKAYEMTVYKQYTAEDLEAISKLACPKK